MHQSTTDSFIATDVTIALDRFLSLSKGSFGIVRDGVGPAYMNSMKSSRYQIPGYLGIVKIWLPKWASVSLSRALEQRPARAMATTTATPTLRAAEASPP